MKYYAFGLTIETDINFDNLLQKSEASTDILITEGGVSEKCGQLTRIHRRGVQARSGKTQNSFILNWIGIGKFKISAGKQIIYQNLGADEGTLKLFLLSEVIGIILYQREHFLLHASAVEIGGKAFVFMGVPGAGKSTTATAFGKAGRTVLTDDLTAIKIIDGKAFVVPAFPQYKVWKSALIGLQIDYAKLAPSFEGVNKFLINQNLDEFPTQPLPLQQLTILFPPNSRITEGKINPVLAPVELLKHFPLPIQLLTNDYLQTHFRQSFEIAKSAEMLLMKRTQNFADLEKFVEKTIANKS